MLCPVCHGHRGFLHIIPNVPKIFRLEEMWYMKPLRKGFEANSPITLANSHHNYTEWPGRPFRPITEREMGYFSCDIFDYEDKMFRSASNNMKESDDNTSDRAIKVLIDLEELPINILQEEYCMKYATHHKFNNI